MREFRSITLLCLCLFAGINGWCDDTFSPDHHFPAPAAELLTNVAGCLGQARSGSNQATLVRLEATITLIDQKQGLMVLQDGSGAMGVYMPLAGNGTRYGQNVLVEGRGVFSAVKAFPSYPNHPSERNFLNSFEAPTNRGNYYLSRFRGYLHPTVSGKYLFWIAADDAGELFLSADASPENKREIAANRVGNATDARDWDHYPSQRSKPITLEAGKSYYIEALHMQSYGRDDLAVAWQGPGMERSVIDGKFLTPWAEAPDGTVSSHLPTNGLLWEHWTNYLADGLEILGAKNQFESFVRIDSLKLSPIKDRETTAPIIIGADMNLSEIPDLHWVQLDGDVTFAAGGRQGCRLELNEDAAALNVNILKWSGFPVERLLHSRIRLQGVLVHDYNPKGDVAESVIWVPDGRQISLAPPGENEAKDLDRVSICDIDPGNPAMRWGRPVHVRGRIISQTTNGLWVLEGYDHYQGFASANGTNWVSLGKPVEIDLGQSAFAGLAIASRSSEDVTAAAAAATFDQLQGWETDWSDAAIGNPSHPGNFDASNGVINVRGYGKHIGLTHDQQYFVFQGLRGDFERSARLADFVERDSHMQAGLMFRDSLNRKAPFVAVLFSPISGPVFQYRLTAGDSTMGPTAQLEDRLYRWMKLVRGKSTILVQGEPGPEIHTNQEVSVSGTITWRDKTPVLAESMFQPVTKDVPIGQPVAAATSKPASIADFAAQVLHPPGPYTSTHSTTANLKGVVTFCGDVAGNYFLFVQDENNAGGIQVRWPNNGASPVLAAGQLVDMAGRSAVLHFPAVFEPSMLEATGWGPLPTAAPYSSTLVKDGSGQARWVEAAGVVRSEDTNGLLNVMTRDGILSVWINPGQKTNGSSYVNATVRLRGVLSMDATRSARLLAPSPEFVEVLESPPADPFDVPAFSIAELAKLDVKPEQLRKMKLRGTVTVCAPEGLFVQDGTSGLFIENHQANLFRPGDWVEAVGFPDKDSNGLVFSESSIRKTGAGALPKSIRIPGKSAGDDKYVNKLVNIQGTLLEIRALPKAQVFTLQAGAKLFEVVQITGGSMRPARIPVGSTLSVTGVYQIVHEMTQSGLGEADVFGRAASFRIWVSDPSGIVLLRWPSWWNWQKVVAVLVALGVALLGTLVWIRILRRRVAEQAKKLQATMQQLEQEARTSAVLAERDRLASEIHDSLQQGLAAILLQLDRANKRSEKHPEIKEILQVMRRMAEFSRAEVQHAVWDLQSPLLANATLGMALKHVANQINFGTAEVKVEIAGAPRSLPSNYEHHLLRIAQEAMTNAIKHAEARTIQITLAYSEAELALTIADDGKGFNQGTVKPNGNAGHFGLHGMRARAENIGAQMEITSQIGKGSMVSVRMRDECDSLK